MGVNIFKQIFPQTPSAKWNPDTVGKELHCEIKHVPDSLGYTNPDPDMTVDQWTVGAKDNADAIDTEELEVFHYSNNHRYKLQTMILTVNSITTLCITL